MLSRKSAILLASTEANGDVSGASITVDITGTNTSHKHSLLHLRRNHDCCGMQPLISFTSQWMQRWGKMFPEGFSRWSCLPLLG